MLNLVAKAFSKRKKDAAKRPDKPMPAPAADPAPSPARAPAAPAADDLSLEELEDMVIAAPPLPAAARTATASAQPPKPAPSPAAAKPAAPPTPRMPAAAPPPVTRAAAPSPERQALIRDALAIQRAKAEVFSELSDEAREKLYVMAMKTMVDKDFGEN